MRAWIRETRGTSWPDPERKGVRHWRSRTIGLSAFWYGAGIMLYGLFIVFVVVPLWMMAEFYLLLFSMGWLAWQWTAHPETRWDGVLVRWSVFWIWDLP